MGLLSAPSDANPKKNLPLPLDALLPLFLGRRKGGCILCNTIIDSTSVPRVTRVPLGFRGEGQ